MKYKIGDKVTRPFSQVGGEITQIEALGKAPYLVRWDDGEILWRMEDELADAAPLKGYIDEALAVVRGNREGVYGRPDANFQTIAALWSTWLSMRLRHDIKLDAADVGHLMILMKSARIANSPTHRDSHVDIAGYLDCIDTIHQLAASD